MDPHTHPVRLEIIISWIIIIYFIDMVSIYNNNSIVKNKTNIQQNDNLPECLTSISPSFLSKYHSSHSLKFNQFWETPSSCIFRILTSRALCFHWPIQTAWLRNIIPPPLGEAEWIYSACRPEKVDMKREKSCTDSILTSAT